MTIKRGKKKRLSSAERREQIVEVALKLFSIKGFRGTTTREIAKEAGISEATIFKLFANKKALYKAIIDKCCSDSEGQLLLIKRLEGKSERDILTEIADFFLERYLNDPTFGRLLLFSALEAGDFSELFIRTRGVEILDYLSGYMKRLMKKGTFKRYDPHLAARAFLGMIFHYCMVQGIFGFNRFFNPPARIVGKTFVDIFLEGIKKGEWI